ncbi:MAG TPA: hypothetical protein VGK25_08055 [Ignavibacteria bacterium]|jgi:hypothetical protein
MKQSASSQKSEQENKIYMENYFNAVKSQEFSRTREDVNNWLCKADIKIKNQTEERKLHKMKNFILAHKLRLVYTVIALVAIIGACNMPVTQSENVGNMITWSVDKGNTDAISKIDDLPWLKTADQVDKNGNINNGKEEIIYTAVLQKSTEGQIASFRNDLEKIGVSALKIIPINNDVKRPLYAAALNNFFSININATGKSDEELQAEVQRQLKEQGVEMNIQFKTDANGKRNIMIVNEKGNETNTPKSYEINIDDNNGKEKIKLMQKQADPEKFKGKTDQEIREIVRKDLDNPDLKDEEIKIQRNGDNVQVKVEVEREH